MRVRALVSVQGDVLQAEVVAGSGDPRLDEAARRSALAWRFRPALRAGRAVEAWVTRNVRFRLDR